MRTSEYLFLTHKGKNLKPLNEKFRELGGFYNGIGYAFPLQQEAFLKQIIDHLPGIKIHKMALDFGQTFDSFRQAHSASYFREKLIKIEGDLLSLQHALSLDDISEETIARLEISAGQKEYAITLLQERERLKEAIDWSEGMEKALSLPQSSKMKIRFIEDREVNFLLEEAPAMPRLVNFQDGDEVKPFIRKGIVGMLVGAGGVGKTHALAQLAIAIATGKKWLGKFPIEKPGYVFMGLGENSDDDIHRLLRKIAKSASGKKELSLLDMQQFQEASKRLAVMSFTGTDATFIHQGIPTGLYQTFINELKTQEPDEGWSCIILDPISRFLGADAETDNAAATRFISLLERIILELRGNPTILFGHHMNKSGVGSTNTTQAAARGSSAITDGVRWQANLERTTEDEEGKSKMVTLKVVKTNFTAYTSPCHLEKDENGFLSSHDPTKLFYK